MDDRRVLPVIIGILILGGAGFASSVYGGELLAPWDGSLSLVPTGNQPSPVVEPLGAVMVVADPKAPGKFVGAATLTDDDGNVVDSVVCTGGDVDSNTGLASLSCQFAGTHDHTHGRLCFNVAVDAPGGYTPVNRTFLGRDNPNAGCFTPLIPVGDLCDCVEFSITPKIGQNMVDEKRLVKKLPFIPDVNTEIERSADKKSFQVTNIGNWNYILKCEGVEEKCQADFIFDISSEWIIQAGGKNKETKLTDEEFSIDGKEELKGELFVFFRCEGECEENGDEFQSQYETTVEPAKAGLGDITHPIIGNIKIEITPISDCEESNGWSMDLRVKFIFDKKTQEYRQDNEETQLLSNWDGDNEINGKDKTYLGSITPP